jgi:MFS family permease
LAFAIAGPVAGWLAVRIGERTNAVVGSAAVTLSMLGLAAVGADSSAMLVVVALALSGLGMGTVAPSMAATVANAVDDRDLGIAGAAQQMVTTLGTVAGIQIMFTVQEARVDTVGLERSFSEAYLVGAAVCLLGVVAASRVRSTRDLESPPGEPATATAPPQEPVTAVGPPEERATRP